MGGVVSPLLPFCLKSERIGDFTSIVGKGGVGVTDSCVAGG